VLQGKLIETISKKSLTEAQLNQPIDFASLPLKDAMVSKQGNDSRKLAVFGGPNCGCCKKFERDLTQLKDVTVYNVAYPVLGSRDKSSSIW
jgi:thiol:disulfide interchange protein DsbC